MSLRRTSWRWGFQTATADDSRVECHLLDQRLSCDHCNDQFHACADTTCWTLLYWSCSSSFGRKPSGTSWSTSCRSSGRSCRCPHYPTPPPPPPPPSPVLAGDAVHAAVSFCLSHIYHPCSVRLWTAAEMEKLHSSIAAIPMQVTADACSPTA